MNAIRASEVRVTKKFEEFWESSLPRLYLLDVSVDLVPVLQYDRLRVGT